MPQPSAFARRPSCAAWITLLPLALLACALAGSLAPPAARAADQFLPPEEAFRYAVHATERELRVTWDVIPGYYLYRKRVGFTTGTPGITLGTAVFPQGRMHEDEFFGRQEIYRGRNVFVVPYTVAGARPAAIELKLNLQGCADAGLCYPPDTWTTRVALPAAKADTSGAGAGTGATAGAVADAAAGAGTAPASGAASSGIRGLLGRLLGAASPVTAADDEFLPVEQAFPVEAEAAGPDTIRIRFAIMDGYYLYRHRMGVQSNDKLLVLGELVTPAGIPHEDQFFGKQEVYRQQVEMTVPFTRSSGARGFYQVGVRYQGCADAGLCYPPTTTLVMVKLPAALVIAAASPTSAGGPSASGAGGIVQGAGTGDASTSATASATTSATATATGEAGAGAGAGVAGAPGLLALLAFAVLGGLLLNLMPCVLPVLSIKAVSLASSAEAEPAKTRAKGWAYTAGVLASMLVLAGSLLALRAAGEQIGWGFQLQQPGFVLALTYLLLLVGLNLSGVFEIGGSFAGAGDRLTRGDGPRSSFFTGVLTTLVATPCTAPFMATAVGVALTQSAVTALAVFAALGIGLALPFLVLALAPAARRFLPKPGAWMHRFRQALAFPMYASAGWLLWVLAQQASPGFLAAAIGGLVLVALAAWCWEQGKTAAGGWRLAAGGVAAAALAVAIALPAGVTSERAQAAPGTSIATDGPWTSFGPGTVDRLVAGGRPVFVAFTADWCVSCKVNERVALETEEAQALFRAKGVALVKADWTNQDATISAELARHGRAGVPLYLFYRPGDAQPQVLPQVLTPGTVRGILRDLPDAARPQDAARATDAAAAASAAIPTTRPEFSLKDPTGKLRSIREWDGRSLIVNFWATWCAPCRREIPLLNRIQAEFAPRGYEVVGIAVDFHEDVVAFMQDTPVEYPVLIGEQDGLDAARAFGVATMAFPFTAFTDRQGRILTVHMGEIHEPEARAILGVVERVNAGELTPERARPVIEQALAALPKTPATSPSTPAASAAGPALPAASGA